MKQIFAVFAMLLSVNVFACQGVVHETLEDAKALYTNGYQVEAYDMMFDLGRVSVLDFSEEEVICFSNCAQEMNLAPMAWICTKCPYSTMQRMRPLKCPNCNERNTFVRGVLTKR